METKRVAGLEEHLGYWMRRVSNRVSGEFARGLGERQTSVAEWVFLRHVYAREETTAGGLAEALGLTRGAITKIGDKLEGKGWIARRADPEDSRVQRVTLTRAGRRALPELAEIADRNDAVFFGRLSGEERGELRRLLEKLAREHGVRDVPIE